MSARRIARRIASIAGPEKRTTDAVSGRSWATKVLHALAWKGIHYSFKPLYTCGLVVQCVVVGVECRRGPKSSECNRGRARARLLPPRGGARRVAWRTATSITALIPPSLVTKEQPAKETA
jgi:hypothetical protein